MDIKRIILGAALAMLAYSLWTAWQIENPAMPSVMSDSSSVVQQNENEQTLLPKFTSDASEAHPILSENDQATTPRIQVKTDVLDVEIDLTEGDIISADLLKYA